MNPARLSFLIVIVSVLGALVGCGGGGPLQCRVPPFKNLPLTLDPSTVVVGEETTVVATFDEPVGPLLFVVGASNGGVECHTGVSGEATLEVVTGS